MKKIKVGAVSYLNTKPLLYGLKGLHRLHGLMDEIELIEDYPSKIGDMLIANEIDAGLVPVAIIPKLKEHYIISDYCIGSENEVASVCLFSEVPIEKIEKILLDYQSKTSVCLCKILMKYFWKKNVAFEDVKEDFSNKIKVTTAGIIIGDRALQQRKNSAYIYDLAVAWKAFTGLPFVFAAWIANKPLPEEFIREFNEANKIGLENIDAVIKENNYPFYDLNIYYKKNISYTLDDDKKKGLQKFLELMKTC